MEPDPDEEDMEYVKLDDKKDRKWRIVFEDNDGGVEYQKAIIHDKRWDLYMNEKGSLIKGWYYV